MGAYDQQLMVADETVFGTAVTVTRGFEYGGDPMPVKPVFARTEGNMMRLGSRVRRAARAIPYFDHGEGHVDLEVMNKGFGFWLKYLLPSVATTGAGPYTHTGTEGGTSASIGKSFTAQLNAPFAPTGANQAWTFSGGKVPKWSLSNSVDEMLVLGLDLWFNGYTTGTALATASYPSAMTNFSWAGGVVTVGGSAFDITDFSLEVDAGYKDDRGQIRGNTAKKEPTPADDMAVSWSIEADLDSLTQFNRVASTSVAGMSASIVGTWTNGADVIAATIPAARFDDFDFNGDRGSLTQSLSGVGEYDGTNSPVTVAYTTTDTTP